MPEETEVIEQEQTQDLPLEQDAPVEETEESSTPKPKETDFDAKLAALADTVNRGLAPKPIAEPELTEEQKREFWAVYDPEKSQKDFFKKWFRLNPEATQEEVDEMKSMWAGVQTGLVKQAVVGSRRLMDAKMKELTDQLAPVFQFIAQQRTEGTRQRFYGKYKALADPKYLPIVQAHARSLAEKDYKNEGEFFKELAEGSAKTIRELVPDFDLGAAPKDKPAGSTPRLPRSSVGGTGGTGKGQSAAAISNDIDSLE